MSLLTVNYPIVPSCSRVRCQLQMLVSQTDAGATLIIHMVRFDNPSSRKYDGDCCDFLCGSCDPSFRFSLDKGNRCCLYILLFEFDVGLHRPK